MAYPTIWGTSTITGSPALSGTAGAGITWFDALLVDGYGSITLTSLAVTSAVATATYSGGHTFPQYLVVEIAGATPSGLNGKKRILSVSGTTFTFDATGIGDQTATGTITAKVPGAGWTKEYTGANKAAYRIDSAVGTGAYLRVDDAATTDMRVVGYMTMSDVDTGTDPFPTAAQVSGGGYWRKSTAANTTARPWTVVMDDRFIYLNVNVDGSTTYKAHCFGDFVSFASSAAQWDTGIAVGGSAGSSSYMGYTDGSNANQKLYIPRLFNETPGAVAGCKKAILSNSADTGLAYPYPVTGGILASDLCIVLEGLVTTPSNVRGKMPGYITFLNECAAALTFATPLLIDGFTSAILPMKTSDAGGPWFGVSLGSWR